MSSVKCKSDFDVCYVTHLKTEFIPLFTSVCISGGRKPLSFMVILMIHLDCGSEVDKHWVLKYVFKNSRAYYLVYKNTPFIIKIKNRNTYIMLPTKSSTCLEKFQ